MKLRNLFITTVTLAATALSTSCSYEKIEPYSGCKAGIYIQEPYGYDIYGNPIIYRNGDESFSFTKERESVKEHITSFNVRLMGEVVNYDRPYVLKVVPDSTTAIEGVDFDISQNEFKIKAGANIDQVRVRLLRNPRLIQNIVKVTFQIEANEYFETPISDYKNSGSWSIDGPMFSSTMFYVKFGEKYIKPDQWDNGSQYYGAWSVNKFLELNRIMGWTVNDWDVAGAQGSKIGYGRLQFAASALQRYLQEQADAGTPVLDDDGSYMQLGASYRVDYSAYN